MNIHTQFFQIPGIIGQLEYALDVPNSEKYVIPHGLVFIAHPHPLFGGSMHNKIVQTLARSFVELGYIAIRMNFRGVGKSEGKYDHGNGETDDMLLLIAYMRKQFPALPIALAGFSFGTYIQAKVQEKLTTSHISLNVPVERLVLVGTAAGKWPIPEVPTNTIVIHGEFDDIIPLNVILDWVRTQELPIIVIPGANHFFHGKLQYIKNLIIEMWHR